MPCILLTGATGYIASHTWLALQEAGFDVVGIDSLVNSSVKVLDRLETIGCRAPHFVQGDVRDAAALDRCFELARTRFGGIQAVVHFAALKAVGESVERPLDYFENNLGGLLSVCQAMKRHGVNNLVFSSSATVYGSPDTLPITEDAPLRVTNPYGQTKLMGEEILRELGRCDPTWRFACLRYFNPVGAHPSGLIGEDPQGIPNNLMPYVAQVAVGQRPHLNVFGKDYDTPDGTGVRDYIHVCDLAEGHVAALRYLFDRQQSLTVNLGTGQGYSVLELAQAYGRASGRDIPVVFAPRRPGDVAACYADPQRAFETMGWKATRGLDEMCVDSWRWQSHNPHGFQD
ncbi:MAG: UDP-glucose 4-epimerase GalE [Aquabacterium sp.]|uniref:UDP-glucose 4-epimerase GalE n=1 Tax=Aquabacterium sp. TaxID=1872578 RepID=UPI001B3F71A0|nr:UDP-glucose 4-epimerase GalE [Aquabacterium sp.]MBP7131701.1 UDP-glucose 4-epimerase GalE [Aquabacterium sp.]MBP9063641.1 UDP-glucose 4-epimerase GalE [Aquabacterium sp.]MDQ5925246.1 UDP-glucose 4-epimerase [Pseudomonadota bacterium]